MRFFSTSRSASRAGRRRRTVDLRPRVTFLEARALLATWTVTSDADGGPGTLRDAVALADPGDTIDFDRGLRGRTIVLNSPLVLSEDLTIDGPGSGRLTISGADATTVFIVRPAVPSPDAPLVRVTIEGLTVADGLASETFIGFSTFGGGVYAVQSDLTVRDVAFVDNSAGFGGGGLAAAGGFYVNPDGSSVSVPGRLTVEDSTFAGNRASDPGFSSGFGGGVYAANVSTFIRDASFLANVALTNGGGAYFGSSTPDVAFSIDGSLFRENLAGDESAPGVGSAAGGAVSSFGTLDVTDSTFEGNRAVASVFASGGAIASGAFTGGPATRLTVRDSGFVDNQAVLRSGAAFGSARGGAIDSLGTARLELADSRFQTNLAEGVSNASGGAVAYDSPPDQAGSVAITGSSFTGNVAAGRDAGPGSAIGATASGGAVNLNTFGATALIDDSALIGNRARSGTSADGLAGAVFGGAISNSGGPLTLTDSRLVDNEARGGDGPTAGNASGGGLSHTDFQSGLVSTIRDVSFVGNSAIGGTSATSATFAIGGSASGGGIQAAGGRIELEDIDLTGNRAIGGDAAGIAQGFVIAGAAEGGGLALGSGESATLRDARIAGNFALGGTSTGTELGNGGTASGGGIAAGVPLVATDVRVTGNRAEAGDGSIAGTALGGGIWSTTSLQLSRSRLAGNSARGGSGASGGSALGGGLAASGVLAILDSEVTGNTADAGPAGQGLGGGVFITDGTTAVIDRKSKIRGNRATTAGNDVYGSYTSG